jgi:hypothetical protein
MEDKPTIFGICGACEGVAELAYLSGKMKGYGASFVLLVALSMVHEFSSSWVFGFNVKCSFVLLCRLHQYNVSVKMQAYRCAKITCP